MSKSDSPRPSIVTYPAHYPTEQTLRYVETMLRGDTDRIKIADYLADHVIPAWIAEDDRLHSKDEAEEQERCGLPGIGEVRWRCMRPKGHDGPCASMPLRPDYQPNTPDEAEVGEQERCGTCGSRDPLIHSYNHHHQHRDLVSAENRCPDPFHQPNTPERPGITTGQKTAVDYADVVLTPERPEGSYGAYDDALHAERDRYKEALERIETAVRRYRNNYTDAGAMVDAIREALASPPEGQG